MHIGKMNTPLMLVSCISVLSGIVAASEEQVVGNFFLRGATEDFSGALLKPKTNPTPPILHAVGEDATFLHEFEGFHYWRIEEEKRLKDGFMDLSEGSIISLMEGELSVWGTKNGNMQVSASSDDKEIVQFMHAFGLASHAWNYVSKTDVDKALNNVQTLEDADYVALPSFFHDTLGETVAVDFFGYVAYLKDTLPTTSKLILLTDSKNKQKEKLTDLDRGFSINRVHWIDCGDNISSCNQQVRVGHGYDLQIFRPPVLARPLDLLSYARKWLTTPKVVTLKDAADVVYIQNDSIEHEGQVLRIVRQAVTEPEQLKYLEASMPITTQIKLLQSASVVIGTTADLTNKLMLMSSEDQPSNIVELVANPDDTDMTSLWSGVRHNALSTCPLLKNVHDVLFTTSNTDTISFDFGSFESAIETALGESSDKNIKIPSSSI